MGLLSKLVQIHIFIPISNEILVWPYFLVVPGDKSRKYLIDYALVPSVYLPNIKSILTTSESYMRDVRNTLATPASLTYNSDQFRQKKLFISKRFWRIISSLTKRNLVNKAGFLFNYQAD